MNRWRVLFRNDRLFFEACLLAEASDDLWQLELPKGWELVSAEPWRLR